MRIHNMQHKQNHDTHRLRWLARGLMLPACLALVACANAITGPAPQDQVRQRAAERWQALVGGEFSRAYSYNTPSYRAVVSPDGYRNRFGSAVVWVGSEIVDVNCPEATKCLARLRLEYKPLMNRKFAAKLSTYVDETWLFEEGQWWLFQDIQSK